MKTITQTTEMEFKLREIIKEIVQSEMMKIRSELLPFISNEEQKDFSKRYKKPRKNVAISHKIVL